MAKLYGTIEGNTPKGRNTKPAGKGGLSALVVNLSDRNKSEYKLLYTGNKIMQVFNHNNDLICEIKDDKVI